MKNIKAFFIKPQHSQSVANPDGGTLLSFRCQIEMQVGAEILTAREQGDQICLWARVDMSQERSEMRAFHVFNTGCEMPNDLDLKYVGTAMFQGGSLVMHVFENRIAK